MFSVILFIYSIGFFGAIIGVGSYMYRYNPEKLWDGLPWFMVGIVLPGVNYKLMWDGFKLYNEKFEEEKYAKKF